MKATYFILANLLNSVSDAIAQSLELRRAALLTDNEIACLFVLYKKLAQDIHTTEVVTLLEKVPYDDLEWDTQIEKLSDEEISRKYDIAISSVRLFRRTWEGQKRELQIIDGYTNGEL